MVFFNYALRKLNAKIVYYGPGLCGKTTNLQWIHDHFEGGQRGKMISLSTEGDRTIFFDLLPLDIGSIRGMDVTLQLYTVPGQVHYNSTRQLVLRGADGVVFVADSQATMRTSNVESLRNLEENLSLQGVELDGFPHVLQFNKRDLGDLISIEDLDSDLNHHSVPFFEATALEGVGVQETLEGIVKLVMRSLRERYEPVPPAGPRSPDEKPVPLDVEVPPVAPFVAPPPVTDVPAAVVPPVTMHPVSDISGVQDDVPTEVYEDGLPPKDTEDDGALPGAAFWDDAEESSEPTHDGSGSDFPGDEPTGSTNFGFAMPFADNETTTDVTELDKDPDEITAETLSQPLQDSEPGDEFPADATESPFEVADLTPAPFESGSVFGSSEDDGVPEFSITEEPAEGVMMETEEEGGETVDEGISFGDADDEDPDVPDESEMAAGTVDDLVASVLGESSEEPDETVGADDDGYGDEAVPNAEYDVGGEDVGTQSDVEPSFDDVESAGEVPSSDDETTAEQFPVVEDEGAGEFGVGSVEMGAVEDDITEGHGAEDVEVSAIDDDGDQAADPSLEPPVDGWEGEDWRAEEREAEDEPDAGSPADDDSEEVEEAPLDHAPDEEIVGHGPDMEFQPPPVAEGEPDFSPVDEFAPAETSDEMDVQVGEWDEPDTDEFSVEGPAEGASDGDVEVESGDQMEFGEDGDEVIEIEPDFGDDDGRVEHETAVDEVAAKTTSRDPVIFGVGDPFGDELDDVATPVRSEVQPHVEISTPVDDGAAMVRAEDNQLHLRLHGTGAIAESGQVRALDIEVPVPGSWVGNRRVTLQLRLTLTPMPEDDDGGPGGAS